MKKSKTMDNILFVARKIFEMYIEKHGEKIDKNTVFFITSKKFMTYLYGRNVKGKRRVDARTFFNYPVRYLHKLGIIEKRSETTTRYRNYVWKVNIWKLKQFIESLQKEGENRGSNEEIKKSSKCELISKLTPCK